ncbi:MAG: hypothetical protein RI988_1157 [Pseudomonadota bacterium]
MSRNRLNLDSLPARLAAVAAALVVSIPARADPEAWPAVVSRQAHLRAGPGPTYPVVAVLVPGTPVEVRGCLPNYSWCDVAADVRRGWMHAVNLEAYSGGDHVRLPDAAALLGIAIIGFALHEYWADHYRSRPWYGQREQWSRPPAPPRAGPPPRQGPGPGAGPGKGPGSRSGGPPGLRPGGPPGQPPGRP